MEALSSEVLSIARKSEAVILQKVAEAGLSPIAKAIGVDESTVCRLKGNETKVGFKVFSIMLAFIGLKIVPVGVKCFRPEDIDPYIAIAKQHMAAMNSAEELIWDE